MIMSGTPLVRMVRARTLFWIGFGLFLASRLFLIWGGACLSVPPRDGADSLTYLWSGQLLGLGYQRDHPALQDVVRQTEAAAVVFKDPSDWPYFVNSRVLGSHRPGWDALCWLALQTGLELRFCCALMETLVAVLMAWGFGSLLCCAAGSAGAGVGLGLLAFMTLPRQGINSFIPSTLALSIGCLLLAYCLRRRRKINPLIFGLFALPLALVHPVGLVYLGAAAMVACLLIWRHRRDGMRPWRSVAGIALATGVAVLTSFGLPKLVPGMEATTEIKSATAQVSTLAQGFLVNAKRAPKMIYDVLRKNWLFTACLVAAMAAEFRLWKARRNRALWAGGLGILALSLFQHLPGFPAELFARVQVISVVLCAGLAGRFVATRVTSHFKLGFGFAAWAATAVFWTHNTAFFQFNFHSMVIHDKVLRERLAAMPAPASIAYLEANVAFQSGLLCGAYRHHALLLSVFPNTEQFAGWVTRERAEVAVLPNFRALNSIATLQPMCFAQKRLGFYLPLIARLEVHAPQSIMAGDLHLHLCNPGPAFKCDLAIQRPDGSLRDIQWVIPAGFEGWMKLPGDGLDFLTSRWFIRSPEVRAWITGISLGPPERHVFWPWRNEATVVYRPRKVRAAPRYEIKFHLADLLEDSNVSRFLPYMPANASVESDDTGLVFIRLRPATSPPQSIAPLSARHQDSRQ